MRLAADLHLAQLSPQVAVALDKGSRLLLQRQRLIPRLKTGGIETVELADIFDPGEHPTFELRPAARCLEKIPPHMRPTKGQAQIVTVLGQAFVGTVTVTHEHYVHEVLVPLGKMLCADIGPTPRSHTVKHDRSRLHHPEIPAMPGLPGDFFKHLPPRFIPMEALFAHLSLIQLGHHRLKQRRYFLQPIRESALGQGDTVRLKLLA